MSLRWKFPYVSNRIFSVLLPLLTARKSCFHQLVHVAIVTIRPKFLSNKSDEDDAVDRKETRLKMTNCNGAFQNSKSMKGNCTYKRSLGAG